MVKIVITNVYSYHGKGDLAQYIAMINSLREILPQADFTLLCWDPDSFKEAKEKNLLQNVKYYEEIPAAIRTSLGKVVKIKQGIKYDSDKSRKPNVLLFFKIILREVLILLGFLGLVMILPILRSFNKNLDKILKEIDDSDIVLSCGGTKLEDVEKPFKGFGPLPQLYSLFYAKAISKKPVVIYSQSIGPIQSVVGRILTSLVLNMLDVIILRERVSHDYTKKVLKVNRPQVLTTADVAFLLKPDEKTAEQLLKKKGIQNKNLIGISSRYWYYQPNKNPKMFKKYTSIMAKVADYLIEKYNAFLLLIPMHTDPTYEIQNDYNACSQVYSHIKNKQNALLINTSDWNPREIMGCLGLIDLLISARMHGVILASTMHTPTLAIAGLHKVKGVTEMLGTEDFIVNFDDISLEKVLAKVETLLSVKDEVKKLLKRNIPIVKNRVFYNAKIVEKIIKYYYSRDVMKKLSGKNKPALEKEFCCSCGTCMGICPSNAIKLQRYNDWIYVPSIDEEKCTECNFCAEVCPVKSPDFLKINEFVFGKPINDPILGNNAGCYIGYASDKRIRWEGASGGLVTALLIYALERKFIDGAIVVKSSKKNPFEPEIIMARSKKEIIEACGSKYFPVPVNISIGEVLKKEKGKFAIVGLPCQILGIRKAEIKLKELRKRIILHLGLFCAHTVSLSGTRFVIEKFMKVTKDDISEIAYRGRGWPGGLRVSLKNGKELFIPHSKYWGSVFGSFFFTPLCCTICFDHTNELADISFGDAWLKELKEDKIGTSLVIPRTEIGNKLLQEAANEKIINLSKISREKMINSQSHSFYFKKRGIFARIKLLKTFGFKLPNTNMTSAKVNILDLVGATIPYLSIFSSSNTFSLNLLKHVPLSLFKIYNYFIFIIYKLLIKFNGYIGK
nr:Coenzyme F420 hydrogenase/dehydrogenase, beta subunit C-terminal domain [Candidatus Freyarchaeota archaeon]